MGAGARVMRPGDAERDRERWIEEGGWVHDSFGGLRCVDDWTPDERRAFAQTVDTSPGRYLSIDYADMVGYTQPGTAGRLVACVFHLTQASKPPISRDGHDEGRPRLA